jgi:hypothetical protein
MVVGWLGIPPAMAHRAGIHLPKVHKVATKFGAAIRFFLLRGLLAWAADFWKQRVLARFPTDI